MFFVTGSRRTDQLLVHPPCPGGACRDQVLKLPSLEDWYWDFPLDVARGGDSMTIVLADSESAYLLHYDAPEVGQPGRWVFEALPKGEPEPDAIWPDTRGGVWMWVSQGLWYRNKDGRWFDVAVPDGETYDFANRLKPREFLALVKAPGFLS